MNDIKDILITDLPKHEDPKLKELTRTAIEEYSKRWRQERMHEEEVVRYMLRHQVKPVIRGEITKGKIKWRGLSIVRYGEDNIFLGLMQRGEFIEPDWNMIKLQSHLTDSLLFGISNLCKKRTEAVKYCTGGIFEQIKKHNP